MQERSQTTDSSAPATEGVATSVSAMRATGPGAASGLLGLRRRVILRGGALLPVGAGVVVLAGCGQDEEPAADEPSADDAQDGGGEDEATEGSSSGFPSGDVPVGGASYDEASNTIYSQPTEGDFRAFDATCPHQGCSVSNVADGQLVCPCHNSTFDPTSGDVLGGPATTGLTVKDVTLEGDDLVVG